MSSKQKLAQITLGECEIRVDINGFDDVMNGSRDSTVIGKRISPQTLRAIVGGQELVTGCLPRNCIGYAEVNEKPYIAVWQPPHVAGIRVSADKLLRVPLPGMVFTGHGRAYRMFAVATNDPDYWPSEYDALFLPPLTNIMGGNSVCGGSNSFPVCTKGNIWQVWADIFKSIFTNHVVSGRSIGFADVRDLWKVIDGRVVFPLDELMPMNKTLKDIIGVGQ